eukprot:TRINITY_DN1881_c0_g1_i1.p1 TRINITY_DN1881_c0_g1~~TRINITY_DN1881_c0_g1_i1.p1  ORF type:complete len:236 (-),score=44.63 TRINITY_DN1881_c0_g1_i1:59-766(-)
MGCCSASQPKTRVLSYPMHPVSQPPNSDVLPELVPQKNVFDPAVTYEIHSSIPKETIKYKAAMPEAPERKLYRYPCPVCFRYFSSMLQCCKCLNYTCRLCGDDIGIRSQEMLSIARCPFCDASPFVLEDVDANLPVKLYTDTPYSSLVSDFRFTGRQTLKQKAFEMQNGNQANNDEREMDLRPAFNEANKKFSSTFPAIRLEVEEDNKEFRNSAGNFKDKQDQSDWQRLTWNHPQ